MIFKWATMALVVCNAYIAFHKGDVQQDNVSQQWDVKQQGESSQQGKNPPPRVVRGTNTEGTAPARSNSRAMKAEADINEEP